MDDLRFGRTLRAARIRHGWRQEDLAAAALLSRGTISRVERGRLDEISMGTLRRAARALDITVDLLPRSRGAELDRARSARHSALAEKVLAWFGAVGGWVVRPEVSFNIWGERGVVDLLAWHGASRTVLVIELKTAIIDVGELLGTLDRKVRLATEIAAKLGWDARSVSVCLLVADGTTNRRRIRDHAATFDAALPDDGRRLRAWLATPSAGAVRARTFVADARRGSVRSGFATPQRVPSRPATRRPGRIPVVPHGSGPVCRRAPARN